MMINRFKDEYRWLSNFADVIVTFEGIKYKSIEHAYQAAKSTDADWRTFCASDISAGKVKKSSRKIEVRSDWEEIKVEVMKDLLIQKFSNGRYKNLLLNTGSVTIQEGNYWGDVFWGIDLQTGEGKNMLGKLIMEIRKNLEERESLPELFWRKLKRYFYKKG
jgi:hypothetical protein